MKNPNNEFTRHFCFLLAHIFFWNGSPRITWPNSQKEEIALLRETSNFIDQTRDDPSLSEEEKLARDEKKIKEQTNKFLELRQKDFDNIPSLEECLGSAEESGLEVCEYEKGVTVTDHYGDWNLTLSIREQEDNELSPYLIEIKLTRTNNPEPWVSVEYFKTFDCPMLVCKPFVHPCVENAPIANNILAHLIQIDNKQNFAAIIQQLYPWNRWNERGLKKRQ